MSESKRDKRDEDDDIVDDTDEDNSNNNSNSNKSDENDDSNEEDDDSNNNNNSREDKEYADKNDKLEKDDSPDLLADWDRMNNRDPLRGLNEREILDLERIKKDDLNNSIISIMEELDEKLTNLGLNRTVIKYCKALLFNKEEMQQISLALLPLIQAEVKRIAKRTEKVMDKENYCDQDWRAIFRGFNAGIKDAMDWNNVKEYGDFRTEKRPFKRLKDIMNKKDYVRWIMKGGRKMALLTKTDVKQPQAWGALIFNDVRDKISWFGKCMGNQIKNDTDKYKTVVAAIKRASRKMVQETQGCRYDGDGIFKGITSKAKEVIKKRLQTDGMSMLNIYIYIYIFGVTTTILHNGV